MKLIYVTTSDFKFSEAKRALPEFTLERQNLEIAEIQGNRKAIAIAKAKAALQELDQPLVVEDVSLEIAALHGLPGPYIKEFLLRLGAAGVYKMVEPYQDRAVEAFCTVAYIEPDTDPLLFTGSMRGTLVKPKGQMTKHITFLPFFQPEGYSCSLADLPPGEFTKHSARGRALHSLRNYLLGSGL